MYSRYQVYIPDTCFLFVSLFFPRQMGFPPQNLKEMSILNGPDSGLMKIGPQIQTTKHRERGELWNLFLLVRKELCLTDWPLTGITIPSSLLWKRPGWVAVCQVRHFIKDLRSDWLNGWLWRVGHMGRIPAGWLQFNCKSVMYIFFACQEQLEHLLCARHLLGSAD